MRKSQYTDEFQLFWKLWPGRWNASSGKVIKVGKRQAFQEWQRIPEEEQTFIIEKVLKNGRLKNRGTEYLQDAHRWLKYCRWEDFE